MAYFANVFRISFDTLAGIGGSKNASLLRELREAFPDEDEEDYDEDEEPPPTLSEAFEAIIDGTAVDDPSWHSYAAASECIYARVGTRLESNVFCPSHPDFVQAVTQALESAGLGDRVPILSPRASPLWPELTLDFPVLSHMTPAEVSRARGAIESGDWTTSTKSVQDALATLARWINEASSRGEGLVCSYS